MLFLWLTAADRGCDDLMTTYDWHIWLITFYIPYLMQHDHIYVA
jgi:hypothetical protein